MENITIRIIKMTDLDAVVDVHRNAFSDRALTSLGREAVRRYYAWQLCGPHDAIALGIFQSEKLVGFCFAGIFRGATSGFLRKNKWFLIWRVITHPWLIGTPLVRERISLASRLLKYHSTPAVSRSAMPAKSFGILAIAINPLIQGVGVGKRLMIEIEKIAVERGFSNLHLTVDVNNAQAISFYENLGWRKLNRSDGMWYGYMVKSLVALYE